jgi:hypothetical protein
MADRRTDDTPIAPRRTLAGAGGTQAQNKTQAQAQNKTQPQSPTQSKTQNKTPDQNSQPARKPVSERLSEKVSGAVSSATETVKSAAEARKTEKPAATKPRPATASPSPRPSGGSSGRVRKARLRMTHIDPWSVMKTSFLLSIALGVVTVIAVAVVWSVLGAAGVWDSINQSVQEVIGGESGSAFDVEDYVGTSRVMGFTMIVAVVDVVLITAIATLGAFLYNLAATLLGGLEVTLAEDER